MNEFQKCQASKILSCYKEFDILKSDHKNHKYINKEDGKYFYDKRDKNQNSTKLIKTSDTYFSATVGDVEITLSKVNKNDKYWQLNICDFSKKDQDCIIYDDYFTSKKEAIKTLNALHI